MINRENETKTLELMGLLMKTDAIVDSAILDIYESFWEWAICDGGDDAVADYPAELFCLEMATRITNPDVEAWDKDSDMLDIYIRIRDEVFADIPVKKEARRLALALMDDAVINDPADYPLGFQPEGLSCDTREAKLVFNPQEAKAHLVKLILEHVKAKKDMVIYVCKDNAEIRFEDFTQEEKDDPDFPLAYEEDTDYDLPVKVYIGID